ncbi:tetratricopeptide repeat protein [Streptomyces sp. NPDC053429]|uniref:tetratricopeptide repeat protein n=1 Tax=Streptomyces sp. NPDC053429 TaxID=3365702 RepID=UPI0037D475B4
MKIGTLRVVQRGPQEPAPWPHQVGVIPSVARSFQHRPQADLLRTAFSGGGTAVLSGMGGVGKTQLAADYARTAWEETSEAEGLDVLVWVTARSRQAIVDGYGQAGVQLCRADPGDPEKAAQTFLAWLTAKAGGKRCRWLVVLDDLADPDDLDGLWPPTSRYGRTLVTTRRRDAALAADGRHTVEVGLFSSEQARAYLTDCLTGRNESAGQVAALAADLGYLPLALSQAAAYIKDADEAVSAYRNLLAERTVTLADTAPDRLPDGQAPLAAAWSLSIERADTLRPAGLSRPMLRLTALLDANGIPQPVLTSAPALAYLAAHRTSTGPHPTEEPEPVSVRDAVQALRALHRLHLIDHNRGTPHQAVRVHQLIQRATRDTLPHGQHHQIARTAADALLAAWPDVERDTDLAAALRANSAALIDRAEDALHTPDIHQVLIRTGVSLGEAGQVTAAHDYFQHLANATAHHEPLDHHHSRIIRQHLAACRGQAGDVPGAITALTSLLNDCLWFGSDSPAALIVRADLAYWWGVAGDVTGAVTACTEVLEDCLRVFGPDHPNTLAVRDSLAYWRGEAGDVTGAVTACTEVLEDCLRVFGPDHPTSLATRHKLARSRGQAGDATGAVTAFTELLEDCLRVLGPDHPNTLATRGSVARWRGEAGDVTGAATAFAELLEDCLRVIGPDHPTTLTIRKYLTRWRPVEGDSFH